MNPRLYQRILKEIQTARDTGYEVSDLENKEISTLTYPPTAAVIEA